MSLKSSSHHGQEEICTVEWMSGFRARVQGLGLGA